MSHDKILKSMLEKLTLMHSQRKKDIDEAQNVSISGNNTNHEQGKVINSVQMPVNGDIHADRLQEDSITPLIPFEPVELKRCKRYYSLSEVMKRYLCSNCDMLGNITTSFGTGRCRRYRI